MKIKYITADTHFGHVSINFHEPSRITKAQIEGFKDFDEYMICTWNETVNDDDNVLHLGDFAFKDSYKIAKKLKGKVALIIGNHDKQKHLDFYKELGWKIIDNIVLDINGSKDIYNKLPQDIINNRLLACLIKDVDGQRIMFSHFPVFDNNPYDEKYKEVTTILEELFINLNCDTNIHGHTHSDIAKEKFCQSACLELNDFKMLTTKNI